LNGYLLKYDIQAISRELIIIKKIYLVRHGQTSWNLEGKTQGSKDSILTSLGLKQAEMLGQRLNKIQFDAIYCSPLKRARSTAQIISNMQNLECILDDRLVEMNFGEWEGLTSVEIQKNYPDNFKVWREQPHIAKIPKGETLEIAQSRMIEFVNNIIESDKQNILVVSHGTTIRLLLLNILSMDLKHYYKLKQDNCAINLIECRPYGPVLIKYNDTCHLDIIIER